jgi:GH25 family lysozyme M1 (1,4-beta-N-acetylmuramidase)
MIKMKLKAIDVSSHQGVIDWDKVKSAGIELAILRCGYGSDKTAQDDTYFEKNYSACKKAGIKVGTYLYSYAENISQAKSEAAHVIRLLKGKKLDFPVYYDLEDADTTGKCSKKVIGDIAETFESAVSAAGYKVGIYANKYWFTSILTDKRFDKWDKWVAQYSNTCTYSGKYTGWQYSSSGKVTGINTAVDMNEFYVDYTATGDATTAAVNSIAAATTTATTVVSSLPSLTGYRGTSIVEALKSKGADSSYASRKKLAEKLGISGYTGTAAQNVQMIKKLGGRVG